jgi:hypothetical protein
VIQKLKFYQWFCFQVFTHNQSLELTADYILFVDFDEFTLEKSMLITKINSVIDQIVTINQKWISSQYGLIEVHWTFLSSDMIKFSKPKP